MGISGFPEPTQTSKSALRVGTIQQAAGRLWDLGQSCTQWVCSGAERILSYMEISSCFQKLQKRAGGPTWPLAGSGAPPWLCVLFRRGPGSLPFQVSAALGPAGLRPFLQPGPAEALRLGLCATRQATSGHSVSPSRPRWGAPALLLWREGRGFLRTALLPPGSARTGVGVGWRGSLTGGFTPVVPQITSGT